jgi:hypothetical protein
MRGIPIVPPAGIIIKTEKKVDTAKMITGTFTPVFTICIKTMYGKNLLPRCDLFFECNPVNEAGKE